MAARSINRLWLLAADFGCPTGHFLGKFSTPAVIGPFNCLSNVSLMENH
jgi:hypothetical protein